jgi:hypothetical protein
MPTRPSDSQASTQFDRQAVTSYENDRRSRPTVNIFRSKLRDYDRPAGGLVLVRSSFLIVAIYHLADACSFNSAGNFESRHGQQLGAAMA